MRNSLKTAFGIYMFCSFVLAVQAGDGVDYVRYGYTFARNSTAPTDYANRTYEEAFTSIYVTNGKILISDGGVTYGPTYSETYSIGATPRYFRSVSTTDLNWVPVASFEDLPDMQLGTYWWQWPVFESRTVSFTYKNLDGQLVEGTRDYGLEIYKCPPGKVQALSLALNQVPGSPDRYQLGGTCYQSVPDNKISKEQRTCDGYGNPIFPASGTKRQTVDLGISAAGLPFVLNYDSSRALAPHEYFDMPGFGQFWLSSLHRNLFVTAGAVVAHRGNGSTIIFRLVGGQFVADTDTKQRLFSDAASGGYFLRDPAGGVLERYSAAGALQSLYFTDGRQLVFSYSNSGTSADIAPAPGYLISVTDQDGRAIFLKYALPAGAIAVSGARVTAIGDASGQTYAIAYDPNGNISTVTWPDGAVRRLTYEDPRFLWALTGIVDENGSRYATFQYSPSGLALSTEHAGGVSRYAVSYAYEPSVIKTSSFDEATQVVSVSRNWSAPLGAVLTLPNGSQSSLQAQVVNGVPLIAGASQPAGSGCGATNNQSVFDANGNVSSKVDFSGNKICSTYDAANREVVRVEGLSTATDCSTVVGPGAALPANARKTTKQWHPDWNLASQVTVQGNSRTNWIYNAQPDPLNSNVLASCTSAPLLPDGTALPLLCKSVRQALTPTGEVDAQVSPEVNTYTYDANGRMLTATDPNGFTTVYSYYTDTSFSGVPPAMTGHFVGDLATMTNAEGLVLTYSIYDPLGRVRQLADPKGVVTDITYTPRGFVNTVSTSVPGAPSRTTTYTYDAVGQRTGVVLPDGTSATYTYDAAHRLVGVSDARGNSLSYTLDNQGNPLVEQLKDPSGNLQRVINRSYDALSRVQQIRQ